MMPNIADAEWLKKLRAKQDPNMSTVPPQMSIAPANFTPSPRTGVATPAVQSGAPETDVDPAHSPRVPNDEQPKMGGEPGATGSDSRKPYEDNSGLGYHFQNDPEFTEASALRAKAAQAREDMTAAQNLPISGLRKFGGIMAGIGVGAAGGNPMAAYNLVAEAKRREQYNPAQARATAAEAGLQDIKDIAPLETQRTNVEIDRAKALQERKTSQQPRYLQDQQGAWWAVKQDPVSGEFVKVNVMEHGMTARPATSGTVRTGQQMLEQSALDGVAPMQLDAQGNIVPIPPEVLKRPYVTATATNLPGGRQVWTIGTDPVKWQEINNQVVTSGAHGDPTGKLTVQGVATTPSTTMTEKEALEKGVTKAQPFYTTTEKATPPVAGAVPAVPGVPTPAAPGIPGAPPPTQPGGTTPPPGVTPPIKPGTPRTILPSESVTKDQNRIVVPMREVLTELFGGPKSPNTPALIHYAKLLDNPESRMRIATAIKLTNDTIPDVSQEAAIEAGAGPVSIRTGAFGAWASNWLGAPKFAAQASAQMYDKVLSEMTPEERAFLQAYKGTFASMVGLRVATNSGAYRWAVNDTKAELGVPGETIIDSQGLYKSLGTIGRKAFAAFTGTVDPSRFDQDELPFWQQRVDFSAAKGGGLPSVSEVPAYVPKGAPKPKPGLAADRTGRGAPKPGAPKRKSLDEIFR